MTDHGINQFSPGPCAYTSTDTQSAFHKHLAWAKANWAQFALSEIGESWDKLSVLFVYRVYFIFDMYLDMLTCIPAIIIT